MSIHSPTAAFAGRLAVLSAAATVSIGAVALSPAGAEAPGSASVSSETLTITGTEADDRIAVRLAPGAAGTLLVDFGDDGTADAAFPRETFTRIEVRARNGDDRFRVDQANGAFADEAITVRGGSGDDSLDGGDGGESFHGGPGDDAVDGNRGTDTAVLGAGDDSFRWDPGDGSDAVEGSQGFDTMDFRGAVVPEVMELSGSGARTVFVREPGAIRMDMHRVERLQLTALGGNDDITIGDLSGTGMTVIDVDLSGPAGGGDALADLVTVNGTAGDDEITVDADNGGVEVTGLAAVTRVTGTETIDSLAVNALEGDDDVTVGDAVAALVGVIVDLGPGQA